MEVPVIGHRRRQRGGHPVVGPESPEQGLRLAESEQVLGDGQLLHPGRLGLLAVRLQLVEIQGRRTLVVRPKVEVVVEHRGPGTSQPAWRISVTPSRMVVSTQTTRGSLTTLSLKARKAVADSLRSLTPSSTPPA